MTASEPAATPAARAPWLLRGARAFLVAHVALIVFSTVALTTFLAGPPAPWLLEEPNATIMRLGWKLSGPGCVVLGALAALLHVAGHLGWRRALLMLGVGSAVALGSELLGTSTQLPFGEYRYTPLLGYRILGLVPFPIPISWFYMIVGSLVIAARLMRVGDDRGTRWRWSLVGGAILVAWDVSMDPAMVKTAHWLWGDGDRFTAAGLPSPVVDFFTKDAFYGMPLSNWLGWYLTGIVIARLFLWIAPPSVWASRLGPTSLPVVLYAVNGIMPIAICFRDRMWWAAGLGTLAMAIPVVLALRAHRRQAGAGARWRGGDEVVPRRMTAS